MNAVAYWDRGVAQVPIMTGAAGLLDGRDVAELSGLLGFTLPLPNVLDVGCGTGRLAQHCDGYLGVDIAPSAITYCRRHSLEACQIDGPEALGRLGFRADVIACLSVFTHISHAERCAYLDVFAKLAPRLLVDIIPGDGSGGIAAWSAEPAGFVGDLNTVGYVVETDTEWAWNGFSHRYFWCVR